MLTCDIRVHGGRVVSSAGTLDADVLIKGEKISAVVDPSSPVEARLEIDATGKLVLPGLVDLHAHAREPGYEHKEDFLSCSRAAAVGGITTFTDMPNVEPPTNSVELFEQKRELAAASCIVDWGHLVSPTTPTDAPRFADAGATGFKIFQVSGGYPHDPRLAMGDPALMYAAFKEIAKTGLHCSVHPFSQSLMEHLTAEALASGKPANMDTFASIYTNDTVWSSAVAVLLELQRATGVRLNLLHTHAAGSLEQIRHAKQKGQKVTAAIDPKYYHLTRKDFEEQGARAAPAGYIVEDPERMAAIWRALDDGTLDLIDSDHAPHTLEDLEMFAKDPWTGPFGSPQYEYLLSLILTDVHDGRMRVEDVVRLMCENPAKLVGHFPKKGVIQVGSDADVVLVDFDATVLPDDSATETKCGWTPYQGRELRGRPVLTIRRGETIAENGKVLARPGTGRYLPGSPQTV